MMFEPSLRHVNETIPLNHAGNDIHLKPIQFSPVWQTGDGETGTKDGGRDTPSDIDVGEFF